MTISQSSEDILTRMAATARREDVHLPSGNVAWRAWGNGPPLVLLHGGHGSWRHWVRNIEALTPRHTVWVPDMPGYGDSDTLPGDPRDPMLLERLVKALADSLNALIGEQTPVDLAGFSFGGLVAGSLAVHRGHVQRLALLGPGGHGGTRRQQVDMVEWRGLGDTERHAALRHNLAAFMLHDPVSIDALALEVHETSAKHTRTRSKNWSRKPVLIEAMKSLSMPVLALWGEHDVTAVPEEAAVALVQGRLNREAHYVRDAGHWVQFEQAEAVNKWLDNWFS
ncbi:alpha/beta fold hydrolase [Ottowia thiooxydans]|uniref:alpha/beta fold hydrolase n=1 Tax=Ottowia thiooxydans TaxID=219182 RepID=UPI0004015416|nr:alpha/beta fold hydrolase [Ottowia thiooxydans]